jgi:glucan biosynthesis protein C
LDKCKQSFIFNIVIFISPWFMPLLFVLTGMSARYALVRRSNKQFVIERFKKLFIPLIYGTFTVFAFMTFMADKFHNNYNGGFVAHYKVFLTNISDMTGYEGYFTPGHLWFLLYLFIISMITIAIIAIQKMAFPKLLFSKLPTFFLPVLLIFPLILSPILDFGGKSIGQDLALFLIEYYVLSEDSILEKMTKYRYVYLIIMLICDISMTFLFVWEGQQTGIVITLCNAGATWFGILGFIGLAKCRYNQSNAVTKYMSANSFLIYIFHFGWLVAIQYYLSKAALNTTLTYILSIAVTLFLTLLTCEIVKRVPGIRFLFGVSKKKS